MVLLTLDKLFEINISLSIFFRNLSSSLDHGADESLGIVGYISWIYTTSLDRSFRGFQDSYKLCIADDLHLLGSSKEVQPIGNGTSQ